MELLCLEKARDSAIQASLALDMLTEKLIAANVSLWEIEDAIRDCERAKDFGLRLVELARAVYQVIDRRAALKRQINKLLGSRLIEEQSYAAYDTDFPLQHTAC